MQRTYTNASNKETPVPGLEEFAEEFLLDRLKEVQKLTDSLKKRDFDGIKAIAHKWRGYSAPYGFGQLEKISILLEENASNHLAKACEDQLLSATKYLDEKAEQLRTSQV